MNDGDWTTTVHSAMYTLLQSKGQAAPVDVLQEMGLLTTRDYENWRFGRVPYLERVCRINLGKLSTIMREMCSYARENNLRSSWTSYRKWGKGAKIPLRFSKSGDEQIERAYATHYLPEKPAERALVSDGKPKQASVGQGQHDATGEKLGPVEA